MFPIRTLCLLGITMVLAGCPASHHGGNFAAAWDLEWIDGSSLITCEQAGAAWVDLEMVDRYNNTYRDRFACTDQNNVSQDLPAGDYSVVLRVRDAKERLLSSTDAVRFTIVSGNTTYLADSAGNPPVMELQSFYADRKIYRGGSSISCAAVNAKWVEVRVQLSTESTATSYLLPCAAYAGETQAIPVGTYSVDVSLVDSSGTPLVDEKGDWSETLTVDGSSRADLGTIEFDVY